MKLLSKPEATDKIKKTNQDLLEENIRLRGALKNVVTRINSAKTDYSSDKVKALKDFDTFVEGIQAKKSKLLRELYVLEEEIENKKEIYYGLVEKEDYLKEKIYEIGERENKLNLRENFVKELEKKHGL